MSNIAKMIQLRCFPYELQLKHVFTLARSSRATTPIMLVELEYDGVIGYGEASMPPYLGESHKSAFLFLQKVDFSSFNDPMQIDDILDYVDALAPGNHAAKAAVDIALHDLVGKLKGQAWHRLWGLDPQKAPYTSYTIGIDTPEMVVQKTREAAAFKLLKVKLGRDSDKEIIKTIRSVTDVPLCVDANQGWTDRSRALDMINWLATQDVVFVEQPMPKEQLDDMAWLTQQSPLPTIADEAVQRLADIPNIQGAYSGINIKLMKSTGIREARKMVDRARQANMKVMLGCMTETSCAVSAAAQLSPLVDWADLDGALLVSNDLFDGMKVVDGKITLSDLPGIGVTKHDHV